MNIFGWLSSFLKSLFSLSRKGLDGFLKANLPQIKAIVKQIYSENSGQTFNDLKPIIFAAVKKLFPALPDNWLSIGIDFGIEHLKAELDKKLLNP